MPRSGSGAVGDLDLLAVEGQVVAGTCLVADGIGRILFGAQLLGRDGLHLPRAVEAQSVIASQIGAFANGRGRSRVWGQRRACDLCRQSPGTDDANQWQGDQVEDDKGQEQMAAASLRRWADDRRSG